MSATELAELHPDATMYDDVSDTGPEYRRSSLSPAERSFSDLTTTARVQARSNDKLLDELKAAKEIEKGLRKTIAKISFELTSSRKNLELEQAAHTNTKLELTNKNTELQDITRQFNEHKNKKNRVVEAITVLFARR
ncbi:hypothetical protein HPY26_15645 [Methylorubrum rhodesianum]|nr:hypothetical protein [Methylorubrum rhodesianum]